MTSTQPGPFGACLDVTDRTGLAVFDDEELGHAGEVNDRLDRERPPPWHTASVTIDALANPPGRSRPRSLGTMVSTWNVRLAESTAGLMRATVPSNVTRRVRRRLDAHALTALHDSLVLFGHLAPEADRVFDHQFGDGLAFLDHLALGHLPLGHAVARACWSG